MLAEEIKLLSDEKLVEKCLAGESFYWEELIKRYSNYIYTIIVKGFSFSQEDIKDVYQEVIVKVLKSLHSLQSKVSFKGYLAVIVKNTCYDELRKRKEIPLEDIDNNPTSANSNFSSQIKKIDNLVNAMHLNTLLKKLPPDYQKVIRMFFYEGYSQKDIAKTLNIKPSLVGIRIHRALSKLREIYKQEENLSNYFK